CALPILRLVAMLQHVHHMGSTDSLGIVHRGPGVAALLEFRHPTGAEFEHVLLAAEANRAGGAYLGAGRLQADGNPVRTQRTLVGLLVHLGDARDVEGTAGDAVAAADAVLADEIDDAVGVL